ncbi:Transcriptional regulators, LysR family [Vibrio coralliirubri]|uniref:LysR family transcriptional regulator n=1 Tax=Vibrio coralliirubri TaxID=1516159 RepID=UPI00063114F4|nr:LysR family transcriptional regulator [Vibrio coralliirubri]CDT34213.1 Transcriptional regulators, LysR family [Vibrio coralliirubri]
MMSNRFKQLDLNLLKVLKVLVEVKNTRKASELLFTSQPSISRSLQKLREYFDDELFIRSQHGLEPTAKLLEIKQTLLPVLLQLEQVLEPKSEFDVAQFDGTVNIAINGFIANSISAKLTQILLTQAPKVKVNIVDWGAHTLDLITSGEVDLGVNYYPLELSKQVYQKRIASDDFVLVCRTGHPLANTLLKSDQQEPLQLASLVVSDWNDNIALAPNVLADVGIKTEVKIRSTYLHSLLSIVKQSDVLFPCSKLLANSLSDELSFVQFPHMPNIPNGDIGMTIGRKHRNQPKMRWLESCIEEVFRG